MRKRIDVDGVSWAYADVGAGPVVVLVHGLGADAASWQRLGRLLARRHRVITVDLPGYSLANDAADPLPPQALAASLDAMLDHLVPAATQLTLIGHSFGASVAMLATRLRPDRCLALVLIAPGGFGVEVSPVLSALSTRAGMAAVRVLHTRALSRPIHRAAERIARVQSDRPSYSLDAVMRAFERLRTRAARDQLRRTAKEVLEAQRSASPQAAGQLPPEVPVLIVWGSQDQVLPAWQADAAKKLLPWSEVRLIDQAGHTPHQTHAGEIRALIDEFLASPAVLARARSREGDAGVNESGE